jgi:hypothetical protein
MSGLLVVGGQTTDETAAGWWLCLHGHGSAWVIAPSLLISEWVTQSVCLLVFVQ